MAKRVRSRPRDGLVPASVYWLLFRLSPLIMLIGMIAGGWLLIRSILVWGVSGPDYPFGIDIPIAAVVVTAWATAAAILLMPPSSVLAKQGGEFRGPALVWPLGQRFRGWTLLAVPISGLLAGMLPAAFAATLQAGEQLWIAVPVMITLAAFSAAFIWAVLRGAILGVELTPTHLIARGYFITKTFARDQIADTTIVSLTLWQSYLLEKFTNRIVDSTLELRMRDGSTRRLLASNSSEVDLIVGAEIVRDWLEAEALPAAPQ